MLKNKIRINGFLIDRNFDEKKYREKIISWRFTALTNPVTSESQMQRNLKLYHHVAMGIIDKDAVITIVLTFDQGHHACGWWKNADYDRCLHLSVSACGELTNGGIQIFKTPQSVSDDELKAWARLVFERICPDAMKWLWYEAGYKTKAVQHIRLFFSKLTGAPILPVGEVYTLKPWGDGEDPEKIFYR